MNDGNLAVKKTGKLHYGWIIMGMGILTTFCALGFGRFSYTLLLPPMQKGLELSNSQAGDVASGNMIGYLMIALAGGMLASRFGPRKVIAFSLLAVGVTMFLTGLSGGFWTAFLWRTLTGMGSGGSNVPVMGLLAAWVARKRRGLAMGAAVAGSSLGVFATGVIIPFIIDSGGNQAWRKAWFILGIITVIAGIAAWRIFCDSPEMKNLAPLGFRKFPRDEKLNSVTTQSKEPLAWRRVFNSGVVWHMALIYATYGFSYIIYVVFYAKYLESELGYSSDKAAFLWKMIGLLSIACGLIWGWISDHIGRKWGLFLVSLLQGGAYLIFAKWQTGEGVLLSTVIFGLTAWSIPAIMAAACGDRLGARMAPAALGLITLFLGIGQVAGPAAAGRIADLKGTFAPALMMAAAAAWFGAILSLFLSPPERKS